MEPEWDIATPRADALIESLRAFGYSTAGAVADLVDNSISAGAGRISIDFTWAGEDSYVTVMDDGRGMSPASLVAAMRPGSTSPLDARSATDLGRYGLGLKTASFSQARELTVASRTTDSDTAIRRWDLDTVASSGEWRLLRTGPAGTSLESELRAPGTLVLWSKLDRLAGATAAADNRAHRRFLETIEMVRMHLESTFHRFLVGRSLGIYVNGQSVQPWDPFLRNHQATQVLESEELPFHGELIRVHPYVLPHRSKLSEQEAARGAGVRGWNHQQGFYVYRSGRLIAQGDWLGLGLAKDEHTKLARIAIEFPSNLDHEWQVDVRKSTCRPPGELAESLKRIARATRSKAEEVYRHRGKVLAHKTSKSFVFAWHEVKDRNGQIRYQVNREHPVVKSVMDAAGASRPLVERALRFIEETVPTTLIGVSIADSLDVQPAPYGQARREIRPLADFAFHGLLEDGATLEEAWERLSAAEPFSQYPEILAALREVQM
jgi:hypothetical protein